MVVPGGVENRIVLLEEFSVPVEPSFVAFLAFLENDFDFDSENGYGVSVLHRPLFSSSDMFQMFQMFQVANFHKDVYANPSSNLSSDRRVHKTPDECSLLYVDSYYLQG
jgi:hypothetical protein